MPESLSKIRASHGASRVALAVSLGLAGLWSAEAMASEVPDMIGPPSTVPILMEEIDRDASPTDQEQANALAGSGGSWEVSLTPYIWFTGLKGDMGVFPALQPVAVDISFGDVVDNLKFATMAILQARNGRFVAVADVSYVDLGTSTELGIRDPGFLVAELDSDTFTSTLAAGYRVVDQGPLFVDLLAGGRITIADTRLELTGPLGSTVGNSSETWLDPVIAARFHAPLGNAWGFSLYGDVGGFGVGSDVTWQLLGVVQYDVSRNWTLSAGWRHYEVDYQNGGFIYDVAMTGPILGATVRF